MTLQKTLALLKRATRTTKLPLFALDYDPEEKRLIAYAFNPYMCTKYTAKLSEEEANVALDVYEATQHRRVGLVEYSYIKKVKGQPQEATYPAGDMRAIVHLVKERKIKTMLDLYKYIVSEGVAQAAAITYEDMVIVDYNGMLTQEDIDLLDTYVKYRDPERWNTDALIVAEGWTSVTNGNFLKQKTTLLSGNLDSGPTMFAHAMLDAKSEVVCFSEVLCGPRVCMHAYARIGEDSCDQVFVSEDVARAPISTVHDLFTKTEDTTVLFHEEFFDFLSDIEEGDYDEKLYEGLTPVQIGVPHHKKISFEFDRESEKWAMYLGLRIKDKTKATKNSPYDSDDISEFIKHSNVVSLPILRDITFRRETQYAKHGPIRFDIRLDYLMLVVSSERVHSIKLQHEDGAPVEHVCMWTIREERGIAVGYSQ